MGVCISASTEDDELKDFFKTLLEKSDKACQREACQTEFKTDKTDKTKTRSKYSSDIYTDYVKKTFI